VTTQWLKSTQQRPGRCSLHWCYVQITTRSHFNITMWPLPAIAGVFDETCSKSMPLSGDRPSPSSPTNVNVTPRRETWTLEPWTPRRRDIQNRGDIPNQWNCRPHNPPIVPRERGLLVPILLNLMTSRPAWWRLTRPHDVTCRRIESSRIVQEKASDDTAHVTSLYSEHAHTWPH